MKGNITDPNWIDEDLEYVEENAIEKKYAAYLETLNTLFSNSTFNLSSVEDHAKCLDLESNYTALDNLLILMTRLAANVSEAETYDEAYSYAVQIPPLYRERLRHDETEFPQKREELTETCGWVRNYGQETAEAKDEVIKDFGKTRDEMEAAIRQFNNLNSSFVKLYDAVLNKIEPTIQLGRRYIERNITKVTLAEEFLTPYFTKSVQDLADTYADIVDATKDYVEEMLKARERFISAYDQIFKLKLPIINNYSVYQLELVKDAVDINDTEIQELVENLGVNTSFKMEQLLRESYDRLLSPTEVFTDPVDDIIKKIEDYTEDLKTYKETATMNTKFYM